MLFTITVPSTEKIEEVVMGSIVMSRMLLFYLGHVPTENVSWMLFKRDGVRDSE